MNEASEYNLLAFTEMNIWKNRMIRKPNLVNKLSKKTQDKINALIPEKIHATITSVMREMIKAVLFGSKHTTAKALPKGSLFEREEKVKAKIKFYRTTAALEGGLTGAGGFFIGLTDFPLLLTLKIKMLYEIASVYGYDLNDYKERIYLLRIFELAFSSPQHRKEIFNRITNWDDKVKQLPGNINDFEWLKFQQEYRDYIDLAKMAQLLPVIGAPVGLIANFSLVKKLAKQP